MIVKNRETGETVTVEQEGNNGAVRELLALAAWIAREWKIIPKDHPLFARYYPVSDGWRLEGTSAAWSPYVRQEGMESLEIINNLGFEVEGV